MSTAAPFRVKVTHYYTADGKRATKDAKGAKKRICLTRTYYGTVGGKRVPLGTSDLGAAWVELRRLQRLQRDIAAGIVGETHDVLARPLPVLLDEWCQTLRDKGTTEQQVGTIRSRLLRLFAAAGWTAWGKVTKDSLLHGLAALRGEGRSNQTSNHYRTHAKGFASWLADRAGARDPLAKVGGKLSAEADPRHPRRCPSDEDMRLLFAHLDSADAKEREGMTGAWRALGYKVCMATGLRAGELRSLTRESFDLDSGTVTVQAAYSKRRRKDAIHLPAWLTDQLRAWFASGGGCWNAFPESFPGRLLKADLAAAGVEYLTGDGYFDMHSLRVWFCTAAANQPGISPKTLMTVCRHSTAQLSLAVYAKSRTADVKAVADQLTDPTRPEAPPDSERKPG